MPRPRVLLVVSADTSVLPKGEAPRKDYRVLAESLGAAILDHSRVLRSPILKRLVRWVGFSPLQVWLAFRERNRYDVLLTDGEHLGLPLALLLKIVGSHVAHLTIGHRITAAKKRPFFRWLKVQTHISCLLLHSQHQYDLAVRDLKLPPERLALIPYQVDPDFWRPQPVAEERLVSSAGLELRDYPTLLRAVEGLNVEVVIGAASLWSKRPDTTVGWALPPNVQVSAFDYVALRDLYARSAIVVVPLDDTDFQAGVTTVLEAMAMGKPVIVTHSRGQTDVIEDRRSATRGSQPRERPTSLLRRLAADTGMTLEPTGFYVPPEDPAALQRGIAYLLDHADERKRLGAAGRQTVERLLTVDQFAARVGKLIEAAVQRQPVTAPTRPAVAAVSE